MEKCWGGPPLSDLRGPSDSRAPREGPSLNCIAQPGGPVPHLPRVWEGPVSLLKLFSLGLEKLMKCFSCSV